MTQNAEYWITRLDLLPHPEGGYFKETFRSAESITPESLPDRYSSARAYATAIYFLLKSGQVSAFHRLKSDEFWCYHAGSALTLYVIEPDGTLQKILLGPSLDNGEQPQIFIKHGVWFGAMVNQANAYALVSCIVSPGFEFDDFELAAQARLLADYPQHRTLIEMLT